MTLLRSSVIIPVYNGAPYLAAAIKSVLAQTCPPAEIIVVDDGSTDDSAAVAQVYAPRVQCVRQTQQGPAAARNAGIDLATGDVLAFLDADDLWLPDKLSGQTTVLHDQPACEAVSGRVENFVSPELDESQRLRLAKSAAQTGHLHVGALLIRRTAFLRVGQFDTRWQHGEFMDWWARAVHLNLKYAVLPDVVMRRRLHTTNLTRRQPQGRADYLGILRERLLQSRQTEPADKREA